MCAHTHVHTHAHIHTHTQIHIHTYTHTHTHTHIRLDYYVLIWMFQDRDAQKIQWINRFVEELKNDKWVLPSLKQIREICALFSEVMMHTTKNPQQTLVILSILKIYFMQKEFIDVSMQHKAVVIGRSHLRLDPGNEPLAFTNIYGPI